MIIYFSLISLFYIVLVILFIYGWNNTRREKKSVNDRNNYFTVIIPVKNEEENIQKLLVDLNNQTYSYENFEVIIVNDNSSDNTTAFVREFIPLSGFPLKLLNLQEKIKGSAKKMAITEGVKQAKGEFIVTTDGDCRLQKTWLEAYNHHFNHTGSNFVAGPVTFHHEKSFFQQLQTIEFASLIGSGAASVFFKHPNMSNAANMAFKKSVFNQLGGYNDVSHIISGDDEFLMQKIFQFDKTKVSFLKKEEAIVATYPQKTLKEFIHQRKRWAGKWNNHKGIRVKLLAVSIFLYHFSFLLVALLTLSGRYSFLVFISQFTLKVLVEFIFLKKVLSFFHKKLNIFRFFTLQIIYSVYVVLFGVLANFGSFQWKGRTYNVREKVKHHERSGIRST